MRTTVGVLLVVLVVLSCLSHETEASRVLRRQRSRSAAKNGTLTQSISSTLSNSSSSAVTAELKQPMSNAQIVADAEEEFSPRVSIAISSAGKERLSRVVQSEKQEAESVRDDIRATLINIGRVLNRLAAQVDTDERVFNEFKGRVLETEVSKINANVHWPAIKNLVKVEIDQGRNQIDSQVATFKLDILDAVQKGLDSIRADLRSTVGGADNSTDNEPQDQPNALPTIGGAPVNVDLSVASPMASTTGPKPIEDYGQTADEALRDITTALQGQMSPRDLRSEVMIHLEKLAKSHLANPTSHSTRALMMMKKTLMDAIERNERAADHTRLSLGAPRAGAVLGVPCLVEPCESECPCKTIVAIVDSACPCRSAYQNHLLSVVQSQPVVVATSSGI